MKRILTAIYFKLFENARSPLDKADDNEWRLETKN